MSPKENMVGPLGGSYVHAPGEDRYTTSLFEARWEATKDNEAIEEVRKENEELYEGTT